MPLRPYPAAAPIADDNMGHTSIESDVVSAFCYFTHHVSGGALCVTDIRIQAEA